MILKDLITAAPENYSVFSRNWTAKSQEMQPRLQGALDRGATLVRAILDDHDTPRPILFKDAEGKHRFWILSENLAFEYEPQEPYLHISITSCADWNITPKQENHANLVAFLPLKFDDCEVDVPGFYRFNEAQAEAVWNFLEEFRDKAGLIVVNCQAGLCRSSAIAAALAHVLNGESYAESIWDMFAPNAHVYDTLMNLWDARQPKPTLYPTVTVNDDSGQSWGYFLLPSALSAEEIEKLLSNARTAFKTAKYRTEYEEGEQDALKHGLMSYVRWHVQHHYGWRYPEGYTATLSQHFETR